MGSVFSVWIFSMARARRGAMGTTRNFCAICASSINWSWFTLSVTMTRSIGDYNNRSLPLPQITACVATSIIREAPCALRLLATSEMYSASSMLTSRIIHSRSRTSPTRTMFSNSLRVYYTSCVRMAWIPRSCFFSAISIPNVLLLRVSLYEKLPSRASCTLCRHWFDTAMSYGIGLSATVGVNVVDTLLWTTYGTSVLLVVVVFMTLPVVMALFDLGYVYDNDMHYWSGGGGESSWIT